MPQSQLPTCEPRFQASLLASSVETDSSQVVAMILDSELGKSSEPEGKDIRNEVRNLPNHSNTFQ